MEKELKTQEELWVEHLGEYPDSKRAMEFKCREQKEAIKWVKANWEDWKKVGTGKAKDIICLRTEKWIIDFFNLTGEDLK